jgi:hypothetical protein
MAVKAWSDPEKAAGMLNRIPVGRFAESGGLCEVASVVAASSSDLT